MLRLIASTIATAARVAWLRLRHRPDDEPQWGAFPPVDPSNALWPLHAGDLCAVCGREQAAVRMLSPSMLSFLDFCSWDYCERLMALKRDGWTVYHIFISTANNH